MSCINVNSERYIQTKLKQQRRKISRMTGILTDPFTDMTTEFQNVVASTASGTMRTAIGYITPENMGIPSTGSEMADCIRNDIISCGRKAARNYLREGMGMVKNGLGYITALNGLPETALSQTFSDFRKRLEDMGISKLIIDSDDFINCGALIDSLSSEVSSLTSELSSFQSIFNFSDVGDFNYNNYIGSMSGLASGLAQNMMDMTSQMEISEESVKNLISDGLSIMDVEDSLYGSVTAAITELPSVGQGLPTLSIPQSFEGFIDSYAKLPGTAMTAASKAVSLASSFGVTSADIEAAKSTITQNIGGLLSSSTEMGVYV